MAGMWCVRDAATGQAVKLEPGRCALRGTNPTGALVGNGLWR
jgi:hypothetical protein